MVLKNLFHTLYHRLFATLFILFVFIYVGFSILQTQKKHEAIERQEMVDLYKMIVKIAHEHSFKSYFIENESYEDVQALMREYQKMTPYIYDDFSKIGKYSLSIEFFTSHTLPEELISQRELLETSGYVCTLEEKELRVLGKVGEKGFLWIKKDAKDVQFINAQLERFTFFIGSLCLLSFAMLYLGYREASLYSRKKEALEAEYLYFEEDARKVAFVDTLTGVATRLKLSQSLYDLIENAKRFVQPFSLILCDIDHFKKINDTYGHDYGDVVLKEIAKSLKENLRESDIVARWGGEEFVIVLPMAHFKSAIKTAEKLRRVISTIAFEKVSKVTCSFGVVHYRMGENEEILFKRADMLLYEAKKAGRNCIKYEKKGCLC